MEDPLASNEAPTQLVRERKVGAREAYREAVDTAGLLAHFKREGIETHDLEAGA